VKARIGQAKTIPFYDSSGEIGGEAFVVEIVSQSDGTVVDTLTMTQTLVPALYVSGTKTFEAVTQLDLKFKYGDAPAVVATDVLVIGTAPLTDVPVTTPVPLTVGKSLVIGTDKVVTARIFDGAGAAFAGSATFAKHTGNQAVTTFSVNNADALTIQVLPDTNAVGAQAAVILCERTEALGAGAGAYAGGSPGDTASYRIDDGLQRVLDLSAVAAGQAAYLAALNAQLNGAYAEAVNGTVVKIVTDSLGSSSEVILSGFGGTFEANTGLAAGVYSAVALNSNVSNSDAVTFSEVKAIIEVAVADAAPGDRIAVTQDATSNALVLTATSGSAGTSSQIDLQAGTSSLLTSLGLAGLGSQGGGLAALGSDGTALQAIYSTAAVGYVVSDITFPFVGDYFVVWHRADNAADPQVPFHFDAIFLTAGSSEQQVNIRVLDPDPDSLADAAKHPITGTHEPHINTKVYVSDKKGNPISYGVTDSEGRVGFSIGPGVYYVTLVKDNIVFGTNNCKIVIQDERAIMPNWLLTVPPPYGSPIVKAPTNAFTLYSEAFSPTLTDPAPPAPMCDLYADLYRMDGSALANAEIYVSLVQAPDLLASGTVVYDTKAFYRTDGHGRVTFSLVQGIKVEVAVAPLSIRRIITVPSGDDAAVPVNLFTLLSQADDMFDIIRPNIATAPRRTLS